MGASDYRERGNAGTGERYVGMSQQAFSSRSRVPAIRRSRLFVFIPRAIAVFVEFLWRWGRALLRESYRFGHGALGIGMDALHLLVSQRAGRAQPVLQDRNRVTRPGLRDLLLRAVGLEEIGRAVAGKAIGQQLDRVGPAGLADPAHHTLGQPADLDEVHAIGTFVVDRVRREPAGEVRDRGRALHGRTHRILVVLDDVHNRAQALLSP